jgi:hypothetical protein
MKTIVYRNYDQDCPYLHVSKIDPFADCINPAIFSDIGVKGHWVVNCEGCPHKSMVAKDFSYKAALLGIKLEEAFGNGFKRNGR